MYARQHPRVGGIMFVRTAGVLLLSLDLVSLAFWLGFKPFGLAPRFEAGFVYREAGAEKGGEPTRNPLGCSPQVI